MSGHPIATTVGRDLSPLGTGGQRAVDCWNTIVLLLERELSPAHAALLAEPLVNAARGVIDWYAKGDGVAAPLSALPEAARDAVNARLDALAGEIDVLAARLKGSAAESDRFLGAMLSLVMQIPGPDYVYAMGAEPVLVAWGHSTGGAAPKGMVLTGRRAANRRRFRVLPPPDKALLRGQVAAPRPASRFKLGASGAGAILLAATLLFLLLAALTWSGVKAPPCAVPPTQLGLIAVLQDAQARGAALQVERARLAEQLGTQRQHCPPAVGTP
jgi:hypothetical protein